MLKQLVATLVRSRSPLRAAIRFAAARSDAPGVAGVILHQGRVLLFEHVFWTAARWGLPGGRVKAGEDAGAALVREVSEECGLDIEIVRLLDSSSQEGSSHYLCRPAGSVARGITPPFERLSFEILTAAWFPPDRLPPDVLPSHRRAIAAAFR